MRSTQKCHLVIKQLVSRPKACKLSEGPSPLLGWRTSLCPSWHLWVLREEGVVETEARGKKQGPSIREENADIP